MQSPPSMVTRSGDSLVVRSVVSGHALFVNDDDEKDESGGGGARHCQPNSAAAVDPDETIEYTSLDDDDRSLPQCKVKRNYACSSCNYFTQNPRHYLYHLRDVHREKVKISECSECLYASRNFQKLVRHMKIVHGKSADGPTKAARSDGAGRPSNASEPFRRTRKRKHLKPSIVEALRRNSNDSVASDDEQRFARRPPKGATKKSASTKAANYRCSLCPFATKNQSHLTRHEKHDHIKTKFFRCVKCNYVTHIKARFTKHVKYHTMPMIKCDVCDFRTPYKWNLDRHYKNHNGRGAFRCGSCNFTADIKQSLTVHEMNHHTPPVGQHAAGTANSFVGVARRRNKVGASDIVAGGDASADCSYRPEEQKETKPLSNYYDNRSVDAMVDIERRDNYPAAHQKRDATDKMAEPKFKHATVSPKKKSRPIPNLIPIKPTSSVKSTLRVPSMKYNSEQAVLSPINISQQDLNDLCARYTNSSLRDFTSLFGDESDLQGIDDKYTDVVEITPIKNTDERVTSKKPQLFASTPVQDDMATTAFFSKNSKSFFDKLKEKLMTGAGGTDANNLTCKGCGHVSKCLSEMAGHQKLCGKFVELSNVPVQDHPSVAFGSTRCQLCRQRCKSSTDLYLHMKTCLKSAESGEKAAELTRAPSVEARPDESAPAASTVHAPHPMENKVFVWNDIPARESSQKTKDGSSLVGVDLSSSSSTVRVDSPSVASENSSPCGEPPQPRAASKPVTHGTDRDLASAAAWKKVFKCPHCSFWATTASRFHVHIVGHLNKKPFECSLCSYRSNWRWDITKHIRLKSVRDAAHERAKVLMTDETGRRNYSKYNKYLTQIQRDVNGDKTTITSLRQTNGADPADGNADSYCEISKKEFVFRLADASHNNSSSVSYHKTGKKSAVPALKPADVGRASDSLTSQMIEDDRRSRDITAAGSKKTLWKCKRCNFRDNNKSILLQHVKEHYRLEGMRPNSDETTISNLTTEASVNSRSGAHQAPFRCGHCHQVSNWKHVIQRHCRLKHQGDVRVVIGGTNGICEKLEFEDQSDDCFIIPPNTTEDEFDNHPFANEYLSKSTTNFEIDSSESNDALFKCPHCPFSATRKQEFSKHLALHGISDGEQQNEEFKDCLSQKRYTCVACPYDSNSKSQYLYHKQFHKPRGAPYKCNICSYNVTRRHLLHQHLKIHGIAPSLAKKDSENTYPENVFNEDEAEDIDMSEINLTPENFLDIPLVWLQKNDKFCKVYQCRYCPFTNVQKAIVQDHEEMHFVENETDFKCSECSYKSNNSAAFTSHVKYHSGEHGVIHCLVDPEKTDAEQVSQLNQLCRKISSENSNDENTTIPINKDLNENIESEMHTEKNIREENEKILYFCDNCPARFLFRKEFDIHKKLHNSRHMFKCSYCTYTARQNAHLLAHSKVHSEDYQNKTKTLQSTYAVCSEHSPPTTTILTNVPNTDEPVWVVIASKDKFLRDTSKDESDLENQISASKVPKKRLRTEIDIKDYSHKVKIKSTGAQIKSNSVPISGTDLYNRKSEVQKQCSQSVKSTAYVTDYSVPLSLHVDPQFGILMHGNPEFIYPTYIKNGKTKEKRYKCHKCPSAFEKREQYKVHLSLHGSKQRYHCEHCDYSVKYYANYVQHVRKHQMNADAQAARRKSYEQSGHLENSENVGNSYSTEHESGSSHYAIKSISCADNQGSLKLSIADKQSLMIIQQRRTNYIDSQKETSSPEDKKTYWCPHCPYTNFRRDAIDNHIKRHVSVSGYHSNYTCVHCDYSVPQSHFLRDHIKLHFLPMKNNKLEAYMLCNKLELVVKDVDENKVDDSDEIEKNIFRDNGDDNRQRERFVPLLDEDAKDSLNIEAEDKVFVDPTSGETKNKTTEDEKDSESNECHDQENKDLDKTKETPGNSIVIKKTKKECIKY